MPGKQPRSLPLPDGQRLSFDDGGTCQAVTLKLDEIDPALLAHSLLVAGEAKGLWLTGRSMFWQLPRCFPHNPASACA